MDTHPLFSCCVGSGGKNVRSLQGWALDNPKDWTGGFTSVAVMGDCAFEKAYVPPIKTFCRKKEDKKRRRVEKMI